MTALPAAPTRAHLEKLFERTMALGFLSKIKATKGTGPSAASRQGSSSS